MKKTLAFTATAIATLALVGCSSGPNEEKYLSEFESMLENPAVMEDLQDGFLQWGYDHCEAMENGLTHDQLLPTYQRIFEGTTAFKEGSEEKFIQISEKHLCV